MAVVHVDRGVITPAQCRGARAMLGWTQAELAGRADLSRKTVADFELEQRSVHVRTRMALVEALKRAGVDLIPGGVRQRSVTSKQPLQGDAIWK